MKLRWKIAQAAEIRWWKRYLRGKDKNSYLNWKKKYWLDLVEQLPIKLPDGARCLDAGCGPAGIFTILDRQKVVALDPLLDAYQQTLNQFNTKDYPNVKFVVSPLEHYREKHAFDFIFCLNAINHVADLDACWDNLFRLTKPGSRLLISIDAHNHRFFKHIFRRLPGDVLHPHQYDLKEYRHMIEKRGGQIQQVLNKKKGFFFDYYVLTVVVRP